MAKFDLEKYWDFRVWVKSQIAQLRALLSEYQQNGGGGGTGGGGDFNPNGSYPNMSVGTATKATSATTADYATRADTAQKAAIADSALFADSAITANKATTAESATHADSADSATIANSAMKAEYATNAGNAERAKIANSAESAKSAASASTATLAINLQNAPELTTSNEQIVVKVGDKTSNALTVPYAQRADFATDLSGRVEATPEVFTYRPSAGDKSIKDDNAFIRRVKGNSIVYGAGQILKEINADNWVQYSSNYTDISFGDNECTLTVNSGYTGGNIYQLGLKYKAAGQKYLANHTYLAIFEVYLEYSGQVVIEVTGTSYYTNKGEAGKWVEVYTTFTPTTDKTTFYIKPPFGYQSTEAVGKTYSVRNAMLFDLTSLYDVEPTFEEFKKLYPEAYYRVGGGELRNLVCWGIKTVGFNQFNGTYARVLPNESYYLGGSYTSIGFAKELGGTTETISIPSNRIYTPTQLGYIYASGTDICINLHHTGYRDGEYEPYKEVTHTLPLSEITNGEPLRKAGSVYDEINETEYIRRVGVRGYATGDKDDATLLTDGRYTNYPLDEPIVKPIETPIDFNYNVEDFGTEEAILAVNSAPFSADIVYQFNATDQVRNNTRNIQRLKKTAFTPSGSTSQYIRGDGSYADVSELSRVIPINDGEGEGIDNEDGGQNLEFRLFPQYYAKSKHTADADMYKEVIIRVEAPDNTDFVAEYWFELTIDETTPNITFQDPSNENAVFRFNGQILRNAVNIWHIITTDGGTKFMGEIKNYVF